MSARHPPTHLTHDVRQALREKAEQATPGPWFEDLDWRDDGADQVVYQKDGQMQTLCFLATGRSEDEIDGDARFIAACDPQTVLALLDALDAAERERDALKLDVQELEGRIANALL